MGMPHDLFGKLGKGIGFVEIPIRRVGDVGVTKLPASPHGRSGIEDRPNRSGRVIGGLRTLVHCERGIRGGRPFILRLDLRGTGVAPIQWHKGGAGAVASRWIFCIAGDVRNISLIVESRSEEHTSELQSLR